MSSKHREGNLRKNASGYYDPTAFQAITNICEEAVAKELIRYFVGFCKKAGFKIDGRITLIHKYSGKKYS